jgi:putative ABC transport system substrate-binding protein
MDRRTFVGGVALGSVVAPFSVHAQQAANVARVGLLTGLPLESPESQALLDAFRQGLRERGYVEGQNIVIEYRSAGWKFERIPDLASELVRLKVDVIAVGSTEVARAVRQVTTTVPIVASAMGDPVEDGLVASLARPGGNVTGFTYLGAELVVKRLELLKAMLPTVSRIAALGQRDAFGDHRMKELLSEAELVARTIGVQLQLVEVRSPGELGGIFSAIARERIDALVVLPSSALFLAQKRIIELAATHRLPAIHFARDFVAIGGLMSYGPSFADLFRRSAIYVDKILKGAKPGDLPIEQPTKFELVINLKTAKALGLTIPQSLLLRADEVIQ